MTAIETKSFAGWAVIGVQAVFGILRAYGVELTPEKEQATKDAAAYIIAAFLAWSGRQDAINAAPPGVKK